jgi:hypothetical protein
MDRLAGRVRRGPYKRLAVFLSQRAIWSGVFERSGSVYSAPSTSCPLRANQTKTVSFAVVRIPQQIFCLARSRSTASRLSGPAMALTLRVKATPSAPITLQKFADQSLYCALLYAAKLELCYGRAHQDPRYREGRLKSILRGLRRLGLRCTRWLPPAWVSGARHGYTRPHRRNAPATSGRGTMDGEPGQARGGTGVQISEGHRPFGAAPGRNIVESPPAENRMQYERSRRRSSAAASSYSGVVTCAGRVSAHERCVNANNDDDCRPDHQNSEDRTHGTPERAYGRS